MKHQNVQKIVVSALASVGVASLVGSIAGTVAWYQYSTRASMAYTGASAKCTENLQVRLFREGVGIGEDRIPEFDSGWQSNLRIADVQNYLESFDRVGGDYALRPVTSGELAVGEAASSFYAQPLAGKGPYEKWLAATKKRDYVELPLQFRVEDVDEAVSNAYIAQNLYLADLTLQAKANGDAKDITSALRVSFSVDGGDEYTFSKYGEPVNVFGALDLDGDGVNDQSNGNEYSYEFDGNLEEIMYGQDGAVAESYSTQRADLGGNWVIDGVDTNILVKGESGLLTPADDDVVQINQEGDVFEIIYGDAANNFKFRQIIDDSVGGMRYEVVRFERFYADDPAIVDVLGFRNDDEIAALVNPEEGDAYLNTESLKLVVRNDSDGWDETPIAVDEIYRAGNEAYKVVNVDAHTIERADEAEAKARFIADDTNAEHIIGSPIAVTLPGDDNTADNEWLSVTVRIYLEGWAELPASDDAVEIKAIIGANDVIDPDLYENGDKLLCRENGKVFTISVDDEDNHSVDAGVAAEANAVYFVAGDYLALLDAPAQIAGEDTVDVADDVYEYFRQIEGGAIWSAADYVGSSFNVGMTFAVPTID